MRDLIVGVKSSYTKGFRRNLNPKNAITQIEKNLMKSAEIIKDTGNTIAPIDSGKLRQSARTGANNSGNNLSSYVEWTVSYAFERYYHNKTNPQTLKWAEQAYQRKKEVIKKIMKNEVLK